MISLKRKPTDPVAEIESEIATLTSCEEKLRGRLSAAESELADARARRRRELIESADSEGGPALGDDTVAVIDSRVAGLRDAVDEIAGQCQAAGRRLAEAREKVKRAEMAEQMAAVHSRIQAALDAHHEAAAALTSALSVVSAGAPLAQQFRGLTEMFAGEVVSLLRQLEGHRAGLLSGAKPIGSVAIGEAAPGGQIEEAA